jgi:(p)ppGpp synthase/HD superfamily hydrolase
LLLRPAQTNLDLYCQLHNLGHSERDLVCIRECYRLASSLFPDRFRASGKPFIAHLVGTASILAAAAARVEVVAAGLLHAVYDQGDFADSVGSATAEHRRIVRDCTGAEIEELVAAYHRLRWKSAAAESLLQAETIPRDTRDVLLMRLANELEDHVSLGMRLCSESRAATAVPREMHVTLARRLDQPALALALEEAYRATDGAHWAAALAEAHVVSYRLPSNAGMTGSQHLRAALSAAMCKLRRLAGSLARS